MTNSDVEHLNSLMYIMYPLQIDMKMGHQCKGFKGRVGPHRFLKSNIFSVIVKSSRTFVLSSSAEQCSGDT